MTTARTILFRGKKHGKSGRSAWVYGDLCCRAVKGLVAIGLFADRDKLHPCIIPVRPETVGQYTGFTDRNEHRIFEHDILRIEYSTGTEDIKVDRIVVWKDGWVISNPATDNTDNLDAHFCRMARIVGNIHDNPTEGTNL